MKAFEGVPLWGAIAILSGILVLGIYLTDVLRISTPLIVAIIVDAVVAWLYLREYGERPMEERPMPASPDSVGRSIAPGAGGMATVAPVSAPPYTSAPEPPPEDEEFDDPVIEADKFDAEKAKREPGTVEEAPPP